MKRRKGQRAGNLPLVGSVDVCKEGVSYSYREIMGLEHGQEESDAHQTPDDSAFQHGDVRFRVFQKLVVTRGATSERGCKSNNTLYATRSTK